VIFTQHFFKTNTWLNKPIRASAGVWLVVKSIDTCLVARLPSKCDVLRRFHSRYLEEMKTTKKRIRATVEFALEILERAIFSTQKVNSVVRKLS